MEKSQGKAKGGKRERKTKCSQGKGRGKNKEAGMTHLNTIQRTAVSQRMRFEIEIRHF